ncbi:LysR family transcriptional regulator [Sphingobium sp. EM0848]|uniref:LysR family transcriptional regulator n=1 Tax=Sphingobium sp. EM0848 TaxID=2743473 RepID=UPI001C3FC7DC|nr:LysR family transcriptional regulator [Sphingobium sp. EM0848]
MNRIDWDDQHAFLAVLEEGSLSAAARRMGVAQPTMRARIEALERRLGTVLFTRSVKGLVPTEQARLLSDAARAMHRASEAFVRAASAPPGEVAGNVRLSVSDFVGIEVLPRMLTGLRAQAPLLIVEVEMSNGLANLLEQEVDVAVRMAPPRQNALVAQKVASIPLGLFAHMDYLAARGVPETVADLAGHDLIGPDRARADLDVVAALLPELHRNRFILRTDSHPAQLAAARAGLGIAVAQRPIGLSDPALRPVLPGLPLPDLDTWIVMHEDLRETPRVRALFDHLVREFQAYCR